jgi:hypothetical protein
LYEESGGEGEGKASLCRDEECGDRSLEMCESAVGSGDYLCTLEGEICRERECEDVVMESECRRVNGKECYFGRRGCVTKGEEACGDMRDKSLCWEMQFCVVGLNNKVCEGREEGGIGGEYLFIIYVCMYITCF